MQTHYCYTQSPVGELMLVGDANGLKYITFQDGPEPLFPENDWRKDAAHFVNAIVQLKEYFAGQRSRFALRLQPEGTDFQLRVLEAVARIPYGQTASYTDIARLLKNPRAVRAVGSANRKNPLPIVVPCHRVIGSDGRLAGFVGGLERKEWLLELECQRANKSTSAASSADTAQQAREEAAATAV
ncbi:MAG: methylated-DNA--[protein]-cysteine S-methyltransferase [Pseudomonadales bacterium]|nr:methylated-DNA--[protein]-cysteine S-methyltransferase [Gammaproteobacteria bacterium]NNL57708.1 methylated-DNA--[protein]-cysteine S-methyltransferase [Pseudomonadales bacterium]